MTRQQMVVIIALNAIISLVVSLVVVGVFSPQTPQPVTPSDLTISVTPTGGPLSLPHALAPDQSTLSTTPTPIIHVVRSGDTLLWIADKYNVTKESIMEVNNMTDPDVLAVGQELGIPPPEIEPPTETEAVSPSPTEPGPDSTSTPEPTPTSDQEEFSLGITNIVARGRQEAEVLVLANYGQDVRLQGWTLSNGREQVYTFPNLILYRGTITNPNTIRLYTREGTNSASDLYWGSDTAAWGPEAESATLRDLQGEVQAVRDLR